ncbi:tetraacyldisaccharide 4'-kinase [Polycladidibacter stylochi]|uniref:tetraacyldisaccharide 4'-kinase n=1 Tax=Polycladidibacter stylochi TaxID=1807766 RepID=UPI00083673CF|nr:tetraacyldisaccharide 4'-kinase [Pseudovibrio stylochi]
MFKKAPDFWWRTWPSLTAVLLFPFSLFYGLISGLRMFKAPRASAFIPVICVGNFTVGGTGKTPFSLMLWEHLHKMGHNPAFLLRGYGGRLKGPVEVDVKRHRYTDVGDEALLLARKAMTIVSADRPKGAKLAEQLGATIIIMDDGFQNPSLKKDLSIILVDSETAIGNGLCTPAGPLRAPMWAQMAKADLVISVGGAKRSAAVINRAKAKNIATDQAHIAPMFTSGIDGEDVLAFAGIGRPQKFFNSVEEAGATIKQRIEFPDHHPFSTEEAEALYLAALEHDLLPVTTSKDFVRLKHNEDTMISKLTAKTAVLEIEMKMDDGKALADAIDLLPNQLYSNK